MFRYIKGTIEMKLAQSVVVECGGVGFEMAVPQNSRLYLAPEGSEVTVFTYMSVREDDISLFGFDDEDGLLLFEKLITVNGIGAKAAMAILSAMPASEVKKAIVFEDADMLTRANGIGKKTAQRIVLELKDKMKDITVDDLPGADIAPAASSSDKQQAIDALMALGYSRTEAAAALVGAEDGLSVEDYIKIALKNM